MATALGVGLAPLDEVTRVNEKPALPVLQPDPCLRWYLPRRTEKRARDN